MKQNNTTGGNQINDLRQMLFNQLERLADPSCNLDKEVMRTKAMTDVSSQLVNSAKVEVDYMRITGQKGSGFIPPSKQIGDGSDR